MFNLKKIKEIEKNIITITKTHNRFVNKTKAEFQSIKSHTGQIPNLRKEISKIKNDITLIAKTLDVHNQHLEQLHNLNQKKYDKTKNKNNKKAFKKSATKQTKNVS